MMISRTLDKAWTTIRQWHEVSRQRRALSQVSDLILKDVGLSRVDAEREASRHFWDQTASGDTSLHERSPSDRFAGLEPADLGC